MRRANGRANGRANERANGRANGRVGGKPRVLRDIGKAVRRRHRFARCRFACPTGTAVSQGFRTAHGFRTGRMATDVPHRRATRVPAASLGKPSLWVVIGAPWYEPPKCSKRALQGPAAVRSQVPPEKFNESVLPGASSAAAGLSSSRARAPARSCNREGRRCRSPSDSGCCRDPGKPSGARDRGGSPRRNRPARDRQGRRSCRRGRG